MLGASLQSNSDTTLSHNVLTHTPSPDMQLFSPSQRASMIIRLFASGLLITVVAASQPDTAVFGQAQPRPAQPVLTVVDSEPPPKSLEGLWQAVDVVVRATVSKSLPPVAKGNPKTPTVTRYHDLFVTEALKGDESLAGRSTIRVKQIGGSLNIDGREVSTAYNSRLLQPNDDIVLFLVRDTAGDGFWIAYASVGAIWITQGDQAILPAAVARMSAFAGSSSISSADLLARLRALKKFR